MILVLESLENSVRSLEDSLRVWDTMTARIETDVLLARSLRAGVIQHFEVAYEQCWKFLQRWLRDNSRPEEADHPRTRRELIRMGAERGLLEDPLRWLHYGDARLFLERLRSVND